MGLLDNLLMSSNTDFSGQQGGLLDMLKTFQMQNSQYQPSAGFGAAASDPSQAQYPGQTGSMAVGNYQMPQIGGGFSPQQDPAALPQNAQAAQGQMPPQAAQGQPQQLPPSLGEQPGGFGGAFRGFAANAHNGPIGMLMGGIGGAMGMEDPAKKQANVTARALISKGVDPQAVQAAIGNPELMKILITQNYGPQTVTPLGSGYVADKNGKVSRAYEPDDKFKSVTVKNADGSESKQAFNSSTGQYTGDAPPPAGKYSVDPSLQGPERLAALEAVDPLYARKIKSMVAGDFPMPTGVAALKPESKRMIEDALAVDGSTSASDFQTRAATRRDYAAGVASRVTKSINTTIGHFATLNDSIDKLNNYTYLPGVTNWVHDKYSSNLDPEYQKAKATFETNKEAAVKELDYALSGGHSSVSGSAELRDKFHRADSPETLHAAVSEAMSLLQKRLESHTKAFTEGTKSQRDPQDFIYPENQQAFSKMLGGHSTAPAAAPKGAPSPGNYVWTPDGGLAGAK